MRKKISITTGNRKTRTGFTRLGDIFEHKFDGFPANIPKLPIPGHNMDDVGMDLGIDFDKILRDLQDEFTEPTTGSVPCGESDSTDSGSTKSAILTRTGVGEYEIPEAFRYIIDVIVDGVPALYQEYTVSARKITFEVDPGEDAVVRGKWVSA